MDPQQELTVNKYRDNVDEEPSSWHRIFDLDSAAKMKPDWYSTRTFGIFLDALDINQPIITDDKKNRCKSSNKSVSAEESEIKLKVNPKEDLKAEENETQQNYKDVETILSAEALKILSELPDLSHMSVTRSFIFPNQKRRQK